jgi:hypothetical protein
VHLDLPPTEYGRHFTRINIEFDDDGKVKRYRIKLSYKGFPAAKDEILAQLIARWGEPKQEEEYGKTNLVFGETPRIVVKEDDIGKGWDLSIGG